MLTITGHPVDFANQELRAAYYRRIAEINSRFGRWIRIRSTVVYVLGFMVRLH